MCEDGAGEPVSRGRGPIVIYGNAMNTRLWRSYSSTSINTQEDDSYLGIDRCFRATSEYSVSECGSPGVARGEVIRLCM
jgi:hypothetical protein